MGREGGKMPSHFKEPRLVDLLRDPLTEVLMARDGVSRDAMMSLLTWVAARQAAAKPDARADEAGAR
jgi:hypothetical protein